MTSSTWSPTGKAGRGHGRWTRALWWSSAIRSRSAMAIDTGSSFADLNPKLAIKGVGAPGYSMVQSVLLMEAIRRAAHRKAGGVVRLPGERSRGQSVPGDGRLPLAIRATVPSERRVGNRARTHRTVTMAVLGVWREAALPSSVRARDRSPTGRTPAAITSSAGRQRPAAASGRIWFW